MIGRRHLFDICVHGPMGSGKSTFSRLLAESLLSLGIPSHRISADRARRNLLARPGNFAFRDTLRKELLSSSGGGPFLGDEAAELSLACSTEEGVETFSRVAWGDVLSEMKRFSSEIQASLTIAEWTRANEDGLAPLCGRSAFLSCPEKTFLFRAFEAGWDPGESLSRRQASGGTPSPGAFVVDNSGTPEGLAKIAERLALEISRSPGRKRFWTEAL